MKPILTIKSSILTKFLLWFCHQKIAVDVETAPYIYMLYYKKLKGETFVSAVKRYNERSSKWDLMSLQEQELYLNV